MGLDPQNQQTCFWHYECVNFKERKKHWKNFSVLFGHAPLGKQNNLSHCQEHGVAQNLGTVAQYHHFVP